MSNELVKHNGSNAVQPHQLAFPAQDPWGTQPQQQQAPSESGGANPLVMLHRSLRGRYPLAIALGLAGATLGAVLGWSSQGQTYRADAKVAYNPTYQIDPVNGGMQTTPFFNQFLVSEANEFTRSLSAERAMNTPTWQRSGDLKQISDRTIREFQGRVSAAPFPNSLHILLTYDHWDPRVATAGANSMLEAYNQYFNERNDDKSTEQLDKVGLKVDESNREVQKFNEDIRSINNEQRESDVVSAHNASQVRLSELQKRMSDETALLNYMRKSRTELDNANRPKPTFGELSRIDSGFANFYDQYLRSEADLVQLKAQLPAGHPRVRIAEQTVTGLLKTLERMRDMAASERRTVVKAPSGDGMISISDESIIQQISIIDTIQGQANEERLRADRLAEARRRVEAILVQRKTAEDAGRAWTNVKDRRGSGTSDGNLIGLASLSPAGAAEISNDRRQKVAMFGAALGFSAPIGLILLFGLFDRRFRYSDEAVGATSTTKGVNLLGILPNLPDRLSDPNQASIAAHCVHQIRTMLQLNCIGDEPAAISVTSAASGDGKTSLSLALGLSFAASGSRTLLIDADIIGAGLSARLGVSEPDGIGEAILSRTILDFVRETDVTDLSILPVGTANPIQASTFSPQLVRRLLNELKKHYDILVIDTGPLMGSIEATPIVAAADTVILTVSRGQNRDLVEQAISHLKSIGSRLAGVVFNRANARDFEKSISGISLRSVARTVPGQQAARAAAMNAGANPIISSMQADSAVASHTHGNTPAGSR